MKRELFKLLPLCYGLVSAVLLIGCADGECPDSDPSYSITVINESWWGHNELPHGNQCYVRNSPLYMEDSKKITKKLDDLDKDYYFLNFDYNCQTSECGRRGITFEEGVSGISNTRNTFVIPSFRFDPTSLGNLLPTFSGYYRTKCYYNDLCEPCNDNASNYHSTLWEFYTDPMTYEWEAVSFANVWVCTATLHWEVFDEGGINWEYPEGVTCDCELKYKG